MAPLARLLRGEVLAALGDESSAVSQLRSDWRSALFANADLPQFADAYAQTLTYTLLLARLDGLEDVGTGEAAQEQLRRRGHALLADVLRNMADPLARQEIATPVDLLERVIGAVDAGRLRRGDADPWLYFYEHFLSAYDPKLRSDRGVYYTPVEVVRAQVRLIGELLEQRFGKSLTYADEGVVTLDPAAGTGTYPLAVIEHALDLVEEREGLGAIQGRASDLAKNVHAFELLVGPYAVAHLRVTERIQARGGALPEDGAHVYLSDTLESPHSTPSGQMALPLRSLAQEHERARQIKAGTQVLVCLGNPPYNRQEIDLADEETRRRGGWVRFGEQGVQVDAGDAAPPILNEFLEPARRGGRGCPPEKPVQRLCLLLALGIVEGLRQHWWSRNRFIHYGRLVPARTGIRRHARGDAADFRRTLDNGPGRGLVGRTQNGKRLCNSDASGNCNRGSLRKAQAK